MQPGKKTPRPEDRSVGTGARRQKFLPPAVYTPGQTGAPALDEGTCHSLLALLLRVPSNILILRGPEHRIKLANSRSSKSGDIGALAGKPFRKALPDLAAQGVLAKLDQAYQTGIPFIGESVQAALDRCGDGILAPAYFKLVFQPTHSRSGSTDGLLIFGGENTEMREVRQQHEQLERLVEERANQLSTIIETITDHVVVYDVEGNGVLMNSAAHEYFARALSPATQAQPLFERVKQHLILDDRGSLENSLDLLSRIFQGETLCDEQTLDVEVRMLNGEECSLNMGGAPLRDHAGRITGAVVTARDVTWRRKMEQRLQANEWKYRRLTEAGIIGVIVIDLEGSLHEANDLFIQMVGYSKEELLSGSIDWSQLTPHEHQKQEEWILPLLRTKGEVPPFQMEYQRKDGSRFPALVTGAMIDQERGLAMELILDISQQQAAERRKQDFLGLVSHELRTPLTVIQGSLELLEMLLQRLPRGSSIEESNALMRKMETLLRQAQQHMSIEDRLVEALLDVSRLEANSFELTLQRHDLAQIVEQTVAVQRQLSPERRLTLCLPGELSVTVLVDADRIGQALINYLNNALRYSWADGEIEIRLEVRGSDARVAVCDSGPGLAEEQQRRVWERFYRVEHHTGQPGNKAGLGLGLSIVQTIIQQHQGQVGVESQPGKGSTFWFTLPLAPKTA